MQGSVFKRGKTWTYACRVPNPEKPDQMKQIQKGGFQTKRSAETALKAVVNKVDSGTYVALTKKTLSQFIIEDWFPSLDLAVAGGSLKATTALFYRLNMETYALPRIGSVMLTALDGLKFNKLYLDLLTSGKEDESGLSPTTVHHVHVTLHKALEDAVRWGILSRNATSVATAPQPDKKEQQIWDVDQLRLFAEGVGTERLAALWILAMTTGLRRGELGGLRWEYVDLDAGNLRVVKTRVSVGGTVVNSTPKSKKSKRVIGLDPVTVAALRAHWERQQEERMTRGLGWTDTGLVFVRDDGGAYHPDTLTHMFHRAGDKVGLPRIPLHNIRHSYATAGLEAGVSLKVMSERLGHASFAITADLYSHVRQPVDQDAANKAANFIFGM